jgi:copper(I)-binding protein
MRQPLKVGDRFKVVLDFLNSGETEIEVFVEEKPGD